MATLYVEYCARIKISCVGIPNAPVILCLRDSALVNGEVCPEPSELTYTGAFAEATLCQYYNNYNGCETTIWYYKFAYDSAILADENTPLQPADILGIVCKDCIFNYFDFLVGDEVHVIDNPDESQTLVSQHGCMYPLVVTGQNLLNCEYVASQFGGYTQAALVAAIATIGVNQAVLYIDCGAWPISENITFPANIDVRVLPGALLTIANTKTVTINGSFTAPQVQVFAGLGNVSFGSTPSIPLWYPQWWGAIGDNSTDCLYAIVKAITSASLSGGGTIKFVDGFYRCSGGFNLPGKVYLEGVNPKVSDLRYIPNTGNFITLTDGVGNTFFNEIRHLGVRAVTNSTGAAIASPADLFIADVVIDDYEIEGFLVGIYLPYGLHVHIGVGRLLGRGALVANGVGIQLGDRTLGTPRLINTAHVDNAYANGYFTSFVSDGSIHKFSAVTSENCSRAFLIASRCQVSASWVQAITTLIELRTTGWSVLLNENYYLDGLSNEVDDISSMCILLGDLGAVGVYNKADIKNPGRERLRFATTRDRGLQFGSNGAPTEVVVFNQADTGTLRIDGTNRPLEVNRNEAPGAWTLFGLWFNDIVRGFIGVSTAGNPTLLADDGTKIAAEWDSDENFMMGSKTMGTLSTDGYVGLPMGAGPPAGIPSRAGEGLALWYWDSANHHLYVYDTAWRGPIS